MNTFEVALGVKCFSVRTANAITVAMLKLFQNNSLESYIPPKILACVALNIELNIFGNSHNYLQ